MVDAVSNNNIIDFNSLDEALAGGDLYDVILALGIETADGLDKAVKDKIKAMKANNEQLKELRDMQTYFSGAKDEDGQVVTSDPATAQKIAQFYMDNPDMYWDVHSGFNFYDANGKELHPPTSAATKVTVQHVNGQTLETVKTQLQNKIDSMTSNAQLDQVELQSLVSKYNNQIDMVSTLEKKREDLASSIIRNMG